MAVLIALGTTAFDSHGAQASGRAHHVSISAEDLGSPRWHPQHPTGARAASRPTSTCGAVNGSSGYVNPLARAKVKSERIDQGVDYAGSGTLGAIGDGKLTYVGMSGTGWPGVFIAYRLLDGPDAGCFVYYAEGVTPSAGLHPGQTVTAGQAIATIIPGWSTGIEVGWGSGVSTKTLASKTGKWSVYDDDDNIASPAGESFSGLIGSLGGPKGKMEGNPSPPSGS